MDRRKLVGKDLYLEVVVLLAGKPQFTMPSSVTILHI